MPLTALFALIGGTRGPLYGAIGPVKQITSSAASRSRPTSKIMVRFYATCGCQIHVDTFTQSLWIKSFFRSKFQRLQKTLPTATYFSALKRTLELGHPPSAGHIAQHIGLSIHQVLIIWAQRRKLSSDSLPFNWLRRFTGIVGMKASTLECVNFIEPRASIQTAKTLPSTWGINFFNCPVKLILYLLTVSSPSDRNICWCIPPVEEARDSDEDESTMDVDVDEVDADSAEERGDWDRMDVD